MAEIKSTAPVAQAEDAGPAARENIALQDQSNKDQNIDEEKGIAETTPSTDPEPAFTVFSDTQRKLIVLAVSFIGLLSPLSAGVYFPAVNTLADDLNVSVSDINLTITTYLIFQAIGPSFFANFSDVRGRRPAYIGCLLISIAANIGLACQNNYAALLVLRCVQSAGSAGTVILGSACVADISTRAERGKWYAYATMGIVLGPAIGPVVGGLMDRFLGWRSIFWFLVIYAAAVLVVTLCFLPETCRAVVGNGSVPPQRWNRTLWACLKKNKSKERGQVLQRAAARPNPIASLRIIIKPIEGLLLLYGALLYGGFYVLIATLTIQLQERYGLTTLQVGLCFIPFGVGCVTSRLTVGILLDRNYKRLDSSLSGNQQGKDSDEFPIEKARLQIGIVAVYASVASVITYGWVMHFRTSLAGPLIMIFVIGNFLTGASNVLNTLIVDLNQQQPATATAANNLTKCLFGAAFTAFAEPLVNAIGIGWTGMAVAALWAVGSPCLWVVMKWGPGWRNAQKKHREQQE